MASFGIRGGGRRGRKNSRFGLPYLVAALPLGAVYLELARRLSAETSRHAASRLFHYSLLYLALLFAAIAVDAAL